MLAVVWPLLWLAFIPIVLIESYVFVKYFPGISYWRITKTTIVANLFSTLIGIPLTWVVLLGFAVRANFSFKVPSFWEYFFAVTLQSPWLYPYESQFYWMIPTACLVLFIPFFFVSVWSEGLITTRFLKNYEKIKVKKITWKANLASYAFLYVIVFGYLIFGIVNKHA